MAKELYAFDAAAVAELGEIVRWYRHYRRRLPPGQSRGRLLPRTYRPFELTENLDAEGAAEAYPLKWAAGGSYSADTDAAFEVKDTIGNCWGLEGDRGIAAARPSDDGTVWEIVENPGQPVYSGTLSGSLAAAGSASVSVTGYDSVTATVYDKLLDTGESLPSARVVLFYYDAQAGKFYVLAAKGCPE